MNIYRYEGVWKKDEIHQVKVSWWHIPNGSDYDHAYTKTAFFSREGAERFVAKFCRPPEMAIILG